ncbi:MAG: sulfur oxidation c-type cytochrome SoxX [Chromatiales bacterium]|nr:sulfur oxidation c-type cytochrome SoxX [Chromatiales bacterium]
MKNEIQNLFKVGGLLAIMVAATAFSSTSVLAAGGTSAAAEGKKIAFSRKKGNCLACHMIEDGVLPGNMGPPLVAMKSRFTKEKLRAQIWDATVANNETAMPPFGRHKILSSAELDKVVEYIWGL